jgi:mycothiol synthase
MLDAIRTYRPEDDADVWRIMLAALEAGELEGTTRHDLEIERRALAVYADQTLVSLDAGRLAGFFATHVQLLIVRPADRRRGHGRRLVEAELARASARGDAQVLLAPPRGSQLAEAFCRALGFRYAFSLWQMRLDPRADVPPPAFPDDVVVRELGPDDLPVYIALVNTSFAEHTSPLHILEEIVRQAHSRPSFDPADIAVVAPRGAPERLVAFCRTTPAERDGTLTGEVHLIGVLPEWRGRGLGRELLRWGVAHLRAKAVDEITLAVETTNTRALSLYERNGFARVQEWPRWARAV